MLYYDRINVSEGIYIDKIYESKECDICHYRCFLDKGFRFQVYVSNSCHDLLMISINLDDIAILKINAVGYCCKTYRISISEAGSLAKLNLKNTNLTKMKTRFWCAM